MTKYRMYHVFANTFLNGIEVPVYTVGEYKSYEEAMEAKNRAKSSPYNKLLGSYLVRIKEHVYA